MDIAISIWTAVALWLAIGWYMNTRLERVHKKLDQLTEQFNGLREYLYEIDPQFDDEREAERDFMEDRHILAGLEDLELKRGKREAGFRTLRSNFLDGGFRSSRDR